MYIDVPITLMIIVASAITWFIGGCIGESRGDDRSAWKGAWIGAIIGLMASSFAADRFQQSEIDTREYENATKMIAGDCRLSTYAASILSDRVITKREYWRLKDRKSELRLGDARSKVNGESLRQCPAAR
jgi:uncharacterized protein YcfJ